MCETIDIESVKSILVPKGDDNVACIEALQEELNLEVPSFRGRRLSEVSEGITFWLVKGKDVPRLVSEGCADIGVTGYDSCLEYGDMSGRVLRYSRIGEPMCRFALLAPQDKAGIMKRLVNGRPPQPTLNVVTSFPKMLGMIGAIKDLPIVSMGIELSGSTEIMPKLLGCDLAADIVTKGETAAANGLIEIENLLDIYPTIVRRSEI